MVSVSHTVVCTAILRHGVRIVYIRKQSSRVRRGTIKTISRNNKSGRDWPEKKYLDRSIGFHFILFFTSLPGPFTHAHRYQKSAARRKRGVTVVFTVYRSSENYCHRCIAAVGWHWSEVVTPRKRRSNSSSNISSKIVIMVSNVTIKKKNNINTNNNNNNTQYHNKRRNVNIRSGDHVGVRKVGKRTGHGANEGVHGEEEMISVPISKIIRFVCVCVCIHAVYRNL